MPNQRFEQTSESERLAVPFSIRSSAAAQAQCWKYRRKFDPDESHHIDSDRQHIAVLKTGG